MTDSVSPRPQGSSLAAAAPESYLWPLVALVLVILPQVLVPERMREGPPLVVPIIEGTVVLVLLGVAAKPGPVPRAVARSGSNRDIFGAAKSLVRRRAARAAPRR